MLKMPITVPYDEKSNQREDTLMRPAQATDCVSRLPTQARVNIGSAAPEANNSVNAVAPPRPIRKFGRPPQKSPRPPKNNLPSAYARTPMEAIPPRCTMASPWLMPRLANSSMINGVDTDRSARQKYSEA